MWYVYVLRSESTKSKTYIGATEDLNKRLSEHNAGVVYYTKRYMPWKIETYIAFSSKDKAYSFEKYLKVGSGKAFLNKRLLD